MSQLRVSRAGPNAARRAATLRSFRTLFGALIAAVLVSLLTASYAGGRAQAAGRSIPPPVAAPPGTGAAAGVAVPGGQMCCANGNGWAPGEPSIAVGGTYVVETVNASVTVYAKSSLSTPVYHAAFYEFFGGTSSTIACIDPRVIYWSWDDRFALVCSDINSTPNIVRFAVSATNDPTHGWYKYAIADSGFLDQPKLVASKDKLVVAGNGANNTTQFYVYQKSDVVHGRSDPRVTHLTSGQNLYQAVVQYTATDDASFVFSYDAGRNITLATITGTPARGNVAMRETVLGVSNVQYPLEPAIPGGTLGGGDLDPRVNNAVYEVETSDKKPVIQYSQSAECNPGGLGATVCIATGRIEMSVSPPVVAYQTLLGAAGSAYTYGAVTLDGYGRVYAAYSRSSATTMPAAAVLGGGSPASTFDSIVQPAAAGTVCGTTSPCDERWGDYLGAAQDPADPSKVWVAALYQASSGEFGWGTIITRASSAGIG